MRVEIRSPLGFLGGERNAHIFWLLSGIPWAELGVAVYSTSWRMRGKCKRLSGRPVSMYYTIAEVTATLGTIGSAAPVNSPNPNRERHVNTKVRFAHFPVPFQCPRGQKRTASVRTEMEERFVFASSTMPFKAMMIF